MKRLAFSQAIGLLLVFAASRARADIYQWEYIDPADPSQGKQQSTTLAPDGAGVDAVPGAQLSGRNLTMAYLIGADLSNASFSTTTLTDADFTSAEIYGANFGAGFCISGLGCFRPGTGITPAQLYSTASYQARNLIGISLYLNNLAGGNFAGQNLTDAIFVGATLTDADFRGANLTNARFATVVCHLLTYPFCFPLYHATLTNADLAGADARGALYLDTFDARTANFIWTDGQIAGLDLGAGELLVVRDYDGNPNGCDNNGCPVPPIPITVDQYLSMAAGGTLRMVFEADDWDSTISFAPGIPVTLGGTLELTFAADVDIASQLGRTFDLFDWTGVHPTGAFAVSSPYRWDTSNLYTTGEVTLTAVPEPCTLWTTILGLIALLAGRTILPRR